MLEHSSGRVQILGHGFVHGVVGSVSQPSLSTLQFQTVCIGPKRTLTGSSFSGSLVGYLESLDLDGGWRFPCWLLRIARS